MPAIEISSECYQKLENIVKQSQQYQSVDALVDFILQTIIQKPDEPDNATSKAIKERLRALGYL